MPTVYAKHLVKLDDLVEKIGRENGGWINKEVAKANDGQYNAIPWFYVSFPLAYAHRICWLRWVKRCRIPGKTCTVLVS